ncbi:hypothetical protein VUR80DRAFT_4549 [Thermomyces stellatus]
MALSLVSRHVKRVSLAQPPRRLHDPSQIAKGRDYFLPQPPFHFFRLRSSPPHIRAGKKTPSPNSLSPRNTQRRRNISVPPRQSQVGSRIPAKDTRDIGADADVSSGLTGAVIHLRQRMQELQDASSTNTSTTWIASVGLYQSPTAYNFHQQGR